MRGALPGSEADGEYYTTCVEKHVLVDPVIKQQLTKLVADASKGVLAKQGELPSYLACYRKWLFAGDYDLVVAEKRAMAQSFAEPLLETFMCNWMRVGVDMANRGCGGVPCTPSELVGIYSATVGDIVGGKSRDLCDGLKDGVKLFLQRTPDADEFCERRTPWVEAFKDRVFLTDVLRGSPRNQVGLLKDIAYRRIPEVERDAAFADMLSAWPQVSQQSLDRARVHWTNIKSRCGATPCEVILGGSTVSSADDWKRVQRVLFEAWMDFFSSQDVPKLTLGCNGDSMTYDAGTGPWVYHPNKRCDLSSAMRLECLSFKRPSGVREAAEAFSDTLGK